MYEFIDLKQTIQYNYRRNTDIVFPVNSPEKNKYSLFYGFPLISVMGDIDFSNLTDSSEILNNNDISLSNGITGYLLLLCKTGKFNKLAEYKTLIDTKLSNISDVCIRNGLSGIGLAYILIYKQLKDETFLKTAIFIEKKIRELILIKNELNNNIAEGNLGLIDGLAGISYFYTSLYECTSNNKYLEISNTIISIIVSQRKKLFKGSLIPIKRDSNILSPYISHGAAGLIKVIIQYLKHSQEKSCYEDVLLSLLDGIDTKFVSNPSYFYGLSGIGDTFIDAYNYFKEGTYLEKAYEIFKSLQLFKVKFDGHYYYPGEDLMNLGLDFEKGLSGILYFYSKLQKTIDQKY
ncbi:hypothetical protein B4102_3837 [Heyndrickxia sporothermodurans]|uniref:Lanthionine synthetase C-like protein n=1 Tax=Heyndrickxia sporothermodurans TaxID=46224 RepID=A0A150KKX5_9BACI|nr:lanthionine synthetase C family protein [Heyndrickxia sporothermodurans]KYC90329.1 hypothetical protein B4102_3837 [Heyndrickxia sporothermodurans]